jgi:hypothetical protein
MSTTLNQSLLLTDALREKYKDRPDLSSLSQTDLAALAAKSGDDRFAPAAQSSAIGRGIARVGLAADSAGQSAENFIAPEGSSYGRQLAGRVASNLIGSAPEMALGVLTNKFKGSGRVASLLGISGFSYGRTMAETGDSTAAAGSAAATTLGALSAGYGGNLARKQAAKMGAGKLGQAGAELAGSTIASAPADALEIASAQGVQGALDYFSDPVDGVAYWLTNAASDPLMSVAQRAGDTSRAARETVKEKTAPIESLYSEDPYNEVVRLEKIPVQERTSYDSHQLELIKKELAEHDLKVLQGKLDKFKQTNEVPLTSLPEAPATIAAQVDMLIAEKRDVVQVPKGTNMPKLGVWQTVFSTYEGSDGAKYLYDERKVNSGQIEQAIVDGTTADLLGYGGALVPEGDISQMAVLRNKQGIEKMSLAFTPETQSNAVQALRKMANVHDQIKIESANDVLAWRAQNDGLIDLFSLDTQKRPDEIGFVNRVLDMFGKSFKPKIKGYKTVGPQFQVDADGTINGDGLYKAVNRWASNDIWEHYKASGIEEFKGQKVAPEVFSTWLRNNTPEVEVRELVPGSKTDTVLDRISAAQHALETRGVEVERTISGENDIDIITVLKDSAGDVITRENAGEYGNDIASAADALWQAELDIDAATGRFNVEPIDVKDMDRPRDILVRVKRASDAPPQFDNTDVHFGRSDQDVVVSVRGYFVKLPNGKLAFYAFEVQSDWGQQRLKRKKWKPKYTDASTSVRMSDSGMWHVYNGETRVSSRGFALKPLADMERKRLVDEDAAYPDALDHPLIKSYETLGVKTTIQHAIKNGADYVIFSDPQTIMMIEGHDRATADVPVGAGEPIALGPVRSYDWRDAGTPDGWKLVQHDDVAGGGKIYKDANGQHYAVNQVPVNEKVSKDFGQTYYVGSGLTRVIDYAWPVTMQKGEIKEAGGMRQHYGKNIPGLARRLTNDKGIGVDLGPMKFGPSKHFLEVGGNTPKTNATGRAYRLDNLSPEVSQLFSLYDLEQQANFEATHEKIKADVEAGVKSAESMTPKAMLDRALKGDATVVPDALYKFLDKMGINAPTAVAQFPTNIRGLTQKGKNVFIAGHQLSDVKAALRTLGHELSHVGMANFRASNPEGYKIFSDFVMGLGPDARLSILQSLKDSVRIGDDFDADYLSGRQFDPNTAEGQQRIVHEYVGGLVEAMAAYHLEHSKSPAWMSTLPTPIRKVLSSVWSTVKSYMQPTYPSMIHMMDPKLGNALFKSISDIQDNLFKAEILDKRARERLAGSSLFDPNEFRQNIPNYDKNWKDSLNRSNIDSDLYSFYSERVKPIIASADNTYQKHWFSALFRTRTIPATLDFFNIVHSFRPILQKDEQGFKASLGDDQNVIKSPEAKLRDGVKLMTRLISPFNKGRNVLLEKYSRIFMDITKKRDELLKDSDANNGNITITEEMLFTDQSLREDYKLSDEDAEGFKKLLKMARLVSERAQQLRKQTDVAIISRLFYKANKAQDIKQVMAAVERLNRLADELGFKQLELDAMDAALNKVKSDDTKDPASYADLSLAVDKMKKDVDIYKSFMDQGIVQEFGPALDMQPNSAFGRRMTEVMVRLAKLRAHEKHITRNEGYVPLTRRGKFFVRVYEDSVMGIETGRVKEARGFKDEKSAMDWLAKEGHTNYEIINKDELKERVGMYTSKPIRDIQERAKKQLDDVLSDILHNDVELSEDQKDLLSSVFDDIKDSYKPLEEEYKEVVSVRGDKFKERRYLVNGFDEKDFIPNLFEYANYKTVAAHKTLTRALGELQIDRAEFDGNNELKQRLRKELNYSLSNQNEFRAIREGTFLYFLGLSVRHIAQNAVQPLMNGVSQLVAEGAGVHAYTHYLNAGKYAMNWARKGTTGDSLLDSMLKQAEVDGQLGMSAIDLVETSSNEMQAAIDHMDKVEKGEVGMGEKINYAASKAWDNSKAFLQSTSLAAERANRVATIIAGVLNQRKLGNKNIKSQYAKAIQLSTYVNFTGDKANRAGFLVEHQGTAAHGALLLWSMLQSFTINHISQLYAFGKKGFMQGSTNDKKAFAVGVAHLLALSGSMGFVGAAAAEQLLEDVTGGFSLRQWIRKGMVKYAGEHGEAMADVTLYGLPGLFGADMSSGIGLGSPFVRYQAGQPITAENVAGPGWGLAARIGSSVATVASDPLDPLAWDRAGRNAAPSFLANALRMYDVIGRGTVLDRDRQVTSDPLNMSESAAVAIGFTPMKVSKERDFKSLEYRRTKKQSESYQTASKDIAELLRQAKATGDPAYELRAKEQFREYLKSVGNTQDRSTFVNSITEQLFQSTGNYKQAATLKTSALRQELEASFPSIKPRYVSELDSSLESLEVAKSLGQDDVLVQKLRSLPPAFLSKVLKDLLVSEGLRPEDASLMIEPSRLDRLGPGPQ